MEPAFFDPWTEIRHTQNRLPHWQQSGATYFVTFRMADAIPRALLAQWEEERVKWMTFHPRPWDEATEREYHTRFSGTFEHWLDAGHGSCALERTEIAAIVAECLARFDGTRYLHHAWVIMPNHVHALFSLHVDGALEKVVHTWKSFTSNRINAVLARNGGSLPPRAPGRRPSQFWQRDYFERLVRNKTHFANCIRYIRRNPEKAKVPPGRFVLFESELARGIE